jgi:transketolase
MAYALYSRHLRFDPLKPDWMNRDRFVLSAGHGSALLYSLLYVFGYEISLDDLKGFRQMGSRTPGHPEYGMTPGVEATTGPLGQGLGMSVGMAIAEAWMNHRYKGLINFHTYALVSDGDLMEGIGAEAASLAGHLGLGKLICLYDNNDISLDGPCERAFTEDVAGRFRACGWEVLEVSDGNDLDAIDAAIAQAKTSLDKPTLISIKTVIGFGSPKAGTAAAHGAPLGAAGAQATKEAAAWPLEPFSVPAEAAALSMDFRERGEKLLAEWEAKFSRLEDSDPDLAAEMVHIGSGTLPLDWDQLVSDLNAPEKPTATRDAGKSALNALAAKIPWLIGGSADLSSSTKTVIDGSPVFSKADRSGRNIWFGVREHAMGAICNGMALTGLLPFGSTFLVFSDYMRPSIRLSALMQTRVLWIFTHDSVFVGEDGPTHQPIEHISSLRLIPGLQLYRPADFLETAACYTTAMERGEPACMILTRQALPSLGAGRDTVFEGVENGAYILRVPGIPVEDEESFGESGVVIEATGSEVSLALAVAEEVESSYGFPAFVVSMPSVGIVNQDTEIAILNQIGSVLPTFVIEAGVTSPWASRTMSGGSVVGIDQFGHSGPGEEVYSHFGLTPQDGAAVIAEVISDLAMMAAEEEDEL